MLDARQQQDSTTTPVVSEKTAQLFDGLAKAPFNSCMSNLEMIQEHGEPQYSRFPSKHKFTFNFGEGLKLEGYSDTWVSPPSGFLRLTLNGGGVPDSFYEAFADRTGRNLYECAINEAQRRLSSGEVTPTLRQKLADVLKDRTAALDTTKAIELINQAVDGSRASDWRASEPSYHNLRGQGYLLDVSDMTDCPPFSSLHPDTRLVIGVSSGASGPSIELGRRLFGSGSFAAVAAIEGEPARELSSRVSERVQSLVAKLTAEKELIEREFTSAVEHGPMQDFSFCRNGDTFEAHGKIGSFNVVFKAHRIANFDGIAALRDATVNIYTQDGPAIIYAKPSQASVTNAFEKILTNRTDASAVLTDRFTEDGLTGKQLLSQIDTHLKSIPAANVKKYHSNWHNNHTTLDDPTWQVTTNGAPEYFAQEYVVVSQAGLSVGCWKGGQSGGYQEAFKFKSPQARAIAKLAIARIEGGPVQA